MVLSREYNDRHLSYILKDRGRYLCTGRCTMQEQLLPVHLASASTYNRPRFFLAVVSNASTFSAACSFAHASSIKKTGPSALPFAETR